MSSGKVIFSISSWWPSCEAASWSASAWATRTGFSSAVMTLPSSWSATPDSSSSAAAFSMSNA